MKDSIKIAIIQDSPVHDSLEGSLEKVHQHLATAAQNGAELVVFGETWLCGYPAWLDYCPNMALWDHPATKAAFTTMYENAVEVEGTAVQQLKTWATKYKVVIVIGVNEKVTTGIGSRTIYNSLLTIGSDGTLLNHHRKLMPTFTEKLLYGLGDGHGLQAVETPLGRIGGLICWEHWMPLTRMTMHNSNELIHVAVWPKVHEMLQLASRSYAFEGRCFVIAVGQIMRVRDVPKGLDLPTDLQNQPDKMLLNGGSCVIGPDGKYLLEPQFDTAGIIYYEINDLHRAYGESMALDVTGHYNRMDIFDFEVNKDRKA